MASSSSLAITKSSDSEKQPTDSKLNPNAQEWKPIQEARMLFVTFERGGAPIDELQVASFFTKKYGDCVEHVYINSSGRMGMEFGSIVFKFAFYPALIMGRSDNKVIKIRGRTLRLKRYQFGI